MKCYNAKYVFYELYHSIKKMKIMILYDNKQRAVWLHSGYLLFPSSSFILNPLMARLIHWLPWDWGHSGLYLKNSEKMKLSQTSKPEGPPAA